MRSLKEMSRDPNCAIELGKAAEYIACADVLLHGYRCYPSDQGLPYDLVLDVDGRLLRVQVKAASFPRNVNATGKAPRMAYSFNVRQRGKNRQSRLSDAQCDLVAFVSLDTRHVGYLPISEVGQTVQLCPPGGDFKGRFSRKRWSGIDGLPLVDAVDRVLGRGVHKHHQRTHGLLEFNGEHKTLTAWAQQYGTTVSMISQRLGRGWTVERAITAPTTPKWSRQKKEREDGGVRA